MTRFLTKVESWGKSTGPAAGPAGAPHLCCPVLGPRPACVRFITVAAVRAATRPVCRVGAERKSHMADVARPGGRRAGQSGQGQAVQAEEAPPREVHGVGLGTQWPGTSVGWRAGPGPPGSERGWGGTRADGPQFPCGVRPWPLLERGVCSPALCALGSRVTLSPSHPSSSSAGLARRLRRLLPPGLAVTWRGLRSPAEGRPRARDGLVSLCSLWGGKRSASVLDLVSTQGPCPPGTPRGRGRCAGGIPGALATATMDPR